jgi:adenylate cyclase
MIRAPAEAPESPDPTPGRTDLLNAALFEAVLLPGRLERTVTPAMIAAQGRLSVAEIAELTEAFGLPRPHAHAPAFTPEEARVFIELGDLADVWPPDVRLQVSRAYGAMLAGIARAEVQAFQTYTEPHVREQGGDDTAHLRSIQNAFARLLPLADPLLLGVHRRWLEHELAQRAVSVAESRGGTSALPGAVEVTFLFCDLKNFTAYADLHGDRAAIAAIDRFFETVGREHGEAGRFVKSLGDGAMLAYDEPADAVTAAARLIEAMPPGLPRVHASAHRGIAIARSGDYFGGSVNLAARLLAFAEGDELVATEQVVDCCAHAFDWEPLRQRPLRGVSSPPKLYRLRIARWP